ncbi:MAG: hypothetical protein CM15mV42_0810 [uncultured marine virus]|nr:MAG: hypothetical protein CM15mV42_0810 [uncultured marine virus]
MNTFSGMNQNLPSISDRRTIFQDAGLGQQYSGTAAQNTQLLNYLQNQPNTSVDDSDVMMTQELDEVVVTAPKGSAPTRLEPLPVQPLEVDPPEMNLIMPSTVPQEGDPNFVGPLNFDPDAAEGPGFLDADGDKIPDTIDIDAGTGTGESVVGEDLMQVQILQLMDLVKM